MNHDQLMRIKKVIDKIFIEKLLFLTLKMNILDKQSKSKC